MGTKRHIALAGTVTAAALALTACGASGSATKAGDKGDARVPAAGTPSAAQAPASPTGTTWKGWGRLSASQNPKVGTTVVDGKGFTLYRFDKDTPRPSVANCTGPCAKLWPPVMYSKKLKLRGIDGRLIGFIETKDHVCQATLGGWPIYRYAKDTAPGQTNGQGVGGTWFAVAPDGKKAGGGSAPPQAPSSPGSGGYGY